MNQNANNADLRTMPVFDENYQNIQHPFTNYSLGEAIALAVNNAKMFGQKVPTTLRETRDYISDMMQRMDHQWLTGYAALDVLDAAIDGKDITKECRFNFSVSDGVVIAISDDDLCSQCRHRDDQPGEMSSCNKGWPGLEDGNGYFYECSQFQ